MSISSSVRDPYRKPGEKEPPLPKKRSWDWVFVVIFALIFFGIFPGVLFLSTSCEKEQKAKSFAGQCRIEETASAFRVVRFDENGHSKVQAYLTFRNEAEQYLGQLDGCKVKIK